MIDTGINPEGTIGSQADGSSRGIPAYLEERGVMLREVHSGYYGPLAYTVASTMMPRPPRAPVQPQSPCCLCFKCFPVVLPACLSKLAPPPELAPRPV